MRKYDALRVVMHDISDLTFQQGTCKKESLRPTGITETRQQGTLRSAVSFPAAGGGVAERNSCAKGFCVICEHKVSFYEISGCFFFAELVDKQSCYVMEVVLCLKSKTCRCRP